MLRAALAATTAALALAAPSALAATPALKAGAAAADITPPISSPMFAYTSRSMIFGPGEDIVSDRGRQMVYDPDTGIYAKTFRAGQGIHTRILTRALVLERDGRRYAMVQADLGGLPYALTQEVLARIADTHITAERLLLSATHTHSSTGAIWPADNAGYAFVGGDAFDPRIFDLTAQGIADAIHQAVRRLEPARAGFAAVERRGASRNRSFEAFQRNAEVKDLPEAEQRLRSTDPTFTVLRVDAADGRPIAAWSNFAKHPTTLDDTVRLFSGDSAGAAARWAEQGMLADWRARGGDAAGARPVNVWTNGAQGDISTDGDRSSVGGQDEQYVESDAAHADLGGRRDAAGILEAWRAAGAHLSDELPIKARRSLVKFDGSSYGAEGGMQEPVGPFPVLGLGVVAEDQCAPVADMAGPGQGPKAPLVGGPGIAPDTFPVSFWQVGDLGIVAYPAEITKQMGQRIREDLEARDGGALDRVALAGLTNGYISYTTTPEEYDTCNYEASFTLFGREEGYAWMHFGRELEKSVLGGSAAPSAPEPAPTGIASATTTPLRATADAGTITAQPAAQLTRYGRAIFKWRGGDQQIDPARGTPFVTLERRVGERWQAAGTDDGLADTTARKDGEWTETWQFDECSAPGIYRLRVSGLAVKALGQAPGPYRAVSREFTVAPVALAVPAPVVNAGEASVMPLYPDPGEGALLALPRLVRDATVTIRTAGGGRRPASDPDGDGVYTAHVGESGVTGADVTDRCGNSGAAG
ncbi:MAG: neutral/alkaline non-lysosomal ceramidase N-terminal domain-containing protein [Solirubrobacteraceae bacterium]